MITMRRRGEKKLDRSAVTDRGHDVTQYRGLRRSAHLFRVFRVERSDPDTYYRTLAQDGLGQVRDFTEVAGRTVLDVGGGPGYFADAFRDAGATYVPVEYMWSETTARGEVDRSAVIGDGMALPIRTAAVDICYSSNTLEHVREPRRMLGELVRVTRPGGLIVLSFTNWLSPYGGHETAPWHYFGGAYAARRYERRTGREPKNLYGRNLFNLSIGSVLRWVRSCPDVEVIDALPRYYPTWTRSLLRLPGAREVLTWNVLIVLRRRFDGASSAGSEAPSRSTVG
jgi:arabinofuranan 3-O-arabinosyltransferase